MKTLRRNHRPESDYFVTVVTYKREPLLLLDPELFHSCWCDLEPFAWVIMPDHFHAIVNCGAKSLSDLVHHFKITYSRRFRDKHRPGRVWQNRFWDHMIRDQEDLNRHLDYIHINPVKHGIVNDPFEYSHSSLCRYLEDGYYQKDWGMKKELELAGEFGE